LLLLAVLYTATVSGNAGCGRELKNDTAIHSFAKGADIGWLSQMEDSGYIFKDSAGITKDCLDILKSYDINSIRLRVWVNPVTRWCGTEDVVRQAVRAKNKGFRIMIDFHYSDWWADWSAQKKPAAWTNDSFTRLLSDIYQYTYHVMDTLKKSGVYPEWAEVGNEITHGMLWPDGNTTHFNELAQLINKGYEAVKAVSPSTDVIIHLHDGGNNARYRGFFDSLTMNGGRFDIIGLSYYPGVNDWTESNEKIRFNLNDMAQRYQKPVMICETGMDYTADKAAKNMLTNLIGSVRLVPGGKGLGVFYWEPESYNWGYKLGAWNTNGKPTRAMDAFMQ